MVLYAIRPKTSAQLIREPSGFAPFHTPRSAARLPYSVPSFYGVTLRAETPSEQKRTR